MTPPFAGLATPRLQLRRLQPDDAAALCHYRSRPEVARYQSWESFGPDDATRLIEDQQVRIGHQRSPVDTNSIEGTHVLGEMPERQAVLSLQRDRPPRQAARGDDARIVGESEHDQVVFADRPQAGEATLEGLRQAFEIGAQSRVVAHEVDRQNSVAAQRAACRDVELGSTDRGGLPVIDECIEEDDVGATRMGLRIVPAVAHDDTQPFASEG